MADGEREGLALDENYEFSAPRYFDFIKGESDEDVKYAEGWFERALSYAPSPFMPRIKATRSINIDALCDFSETDKSPKIAESSELSTIMSSSEENAQSDSIVSEIKEVNEKSRPAPVQEHSLVLDNQVLNKAATEHSEAEGSPARDNDGLRSGDSSAARQTRDIIDIDTHVVEACTPKPVVLSQKVDKQVVESKQQKSGKMLAPSSRKPSALKQKNLSQLSNAKSGKQSSVRRDISSKNVSATPNLAQEHQAIKRQKLDGGKSRQILNFKTQNLLHKSRPDLTNSSFAQASTVKTVKEDRKIYVREPAAPPFVSMAEMIKKFQSNTRDLSLARTDTSMSHEDAASIIQRKPKLTLTRPKEPEFETAQRVRSVKIKSTAELEEEMMAKIPKFKARPLNKKILEARTLNVLPRSTPHPPEFQEFHLETMARANQHAETSTVASTESSSSHQNPQWRFHLTEPKTPVLQTSLRARPPKVKSSSELELEELQRIPRFKAKPLNKKIFESKGELGMFCNTKKSITVPKEFHFATDERIPPQASVVDIFDKLSISSHPRQENQVPKITMPNPFHLHTEERGAEKERKFVTELMQKQLEMEKARVPRANPYPYTTDYPVFPPKPEPKQCTKPEPFQLESLVRHEEELQKEMEEKQRLEREQAQMRIFKAQPVLKEDPIPVPEKVRKPLTQVEEFNLLVDHRAVDRAEFDKKIKEKEMMYKRYREESETAKMIEEEKALKQMRRTMVPHAKPLPKFDNPFCPQKSSKGTTKPKSPNLRVLQRKEQRRKVFGSGALIAPVSSAATNMR